ncbi:MULTISPECIES: MoaF C-terminal domain-containing protein [unclassified Serratia (in: enterobacteria)]|uniref:MoaF C-terminal domain-containing protein n=1 Tax=unclassified Serratia (in: enterobacteria) TaxID=2647522 RepID=UPI000503E0D5|nr:MULTISPECIES: MoaF C-terminal domain-containing protein [unclassified Serratia (in: enterobacteria)]KFK94988.1 moaF [Serratia sp. Ag2]KFK96949.1 moaF [Serratia sp. Ag1]
MSSEAVFIQVGALAEGFAPHSHTLEQQDLAGVELVFHFSAGETVNCSFNDDQTLQWAEQRVDYRATSIRSGILFIDFLEPQRANGSITLVCDRQQGNFTAVYGQLPDETQVRLDAFTRVEQGLPLTAVEVELRFGRLDRSTAPLPQLTNELIGMRNLYTYSPTERYEHIYLNDNFYAWQCLDGVEKGLADVDRCHYVKVAEKLYLFVWREKIVPTLGVVMIDLQSMRTDGKILGYQGSDFNALSNFAVGAHAQILNITQHP